MSDDILREVGKALDRPTRQEVLARLRGPAPRKLKRKAADVIRGDCAAAWSDGGVVRDHRAVPVLAPLPPRNY